MRALQDDPLRYELANELHARPFPLLTAPCTAAFLAIRPAKGAMPEPQEARARLVELLDRFGAAHPPPEATHYSGEIGRYTLKWEKHTEFVTYSLFDRSEPERPFDPALFDVFPEDWLAAINGRRITSALIQVLPWTEDAQVVERLTADFVPESMAVARVLDGAAVIAGDFRIDPAGHMRFGVYAAPGTGATRVGRIVQRLCEIETYKAMSMLGFAKVREMAGEMQAIDRRLSKLMSEMTDSATAPDATLDSLLQASAELESLVAKSAFRFGATGAYEAIVNQRVSILRETRFMGWQTFGEFMMRRYDPAMRTVKSTQARLDTMSGRAMRAGELLRTRVDVDRSAQNQDLLQGINRRADLQLRLQRTVEGLSVVAISYYAVSLAAYLLAPVAPHLGLGKAEMVALITLPVVGAVWWMIRRIHASMEK